MNKQIRCFFALLLCLHSLGTQAQVSQDPTQRPNNAGKLYIEVSGLKGALYDNVRQYLPKEAISLQNYAQIRRYQIQLPPQITTALQALGYYDATITHKIVPQSAQEWQLKFDVQAGEPVRVVLRNIIVKGDDDTLQQEALSLFPAAGQIFHHGNYQAAKSTLLSKAIALGYMNAQYNQSRVSVNLQQHAANLDIEFEPGARHKFGDVIFVGSDLDQDYLAKFNPVVTGDWYNQEPLLTLQNNLEQSGYFSNVIINPEFANTNDDFQIPIKAELAPKKRYLYRFKVGASTDSEWRLAFDFENRQANTLGHSFTTGFEYSPDKSNAHFLYQIPLNKPLTDKLVLSTTWEHLVEEIGRSTQLNLRAARERQKDNGWIETIGISYLHESLDAQSTLINSSNDLLIPEFSYQNRSTDDIKYPTEGYNWYYGIKGTDQALGSTNVSFFQIDVRGKYIYLFQPKHRLLFNTQLGYTFIDENRFNQYMPASLRYLTGGDNSVRGYAYKSLGPKDDDGNLLGGMNLITSSFEYDYRWKDDWLFAAFYDMGNSFNDYTKMSFKKSVGIGPRWLSPVGPIRLSVAKALDDEKRWRLHLTMGFDL